VLNVNEDDTGRLSPGRGRNCLGLKFGAFRLPNCTLRDEGTDEDRHVTFEGSSALCIADDSRAWTDKGIHASFGPVMSALGERKGDYHFQDANE
jgi:hypothetical protein